MRASVVGRRTEEVKKNELYLGTSTSTSTSTVLVLVYKVTNC
jgi:hypothetical protein